VKIAISATSSDIHAPLDPRFGRGAYFVILDTESGVWKSHPNAAVGAGGGAGVQAAQFMAGHGVQAVISGDFGPNAFTTLQAAGIQMFMARQGTVAEAVEQFKAGALPSVNAATHGSKHGGAGGGRG